MIINYTLILIMEKRTCKSYEIKDIDNIKIKIGTTEKNETWVIYATGKTKITYKGEEDPFKEYTSCIDLFNKFVEDEIKNNSLLQNSFIGTPTVSETNLKVKNYTKLDYEIYVKLVEPKIINTFLPEIEPFFKKIFLKLNEILSNHGFMF